MVDKSGRAFDIDALLEGEARFRMLLETAFDGILISQDGVITEASDSLLARSGYTRDELVGQSVLDFVAPEHRERVQEWRETGAEGRLGAAAVLKDGRMLDIELITRKYEVGGRVSRITALRDVSEQRRLHDLVRNTLKMEVIGQLATGIAHDFNNLLTVIRGYSDSLLQELSEPHRSDVEEIMKAAGTAAALTRELLAYGRQQPQKQIIVDLNAVLKQSERWLRGLLGAEIVLAMDLDPATGRVQLDLNQLQQVILNLAVNARDAMPRGGRLLISTRNAAVRDQEPGGPSPGRYVVCEVRDSGSGMSDEVKTRIFDPFFTTKEMGRGTGLGLTLVHGIVERNGGYIVVDSRVGEGTSFSIHLPLVHADHTP